MSAHTPGPSESLVARDFNQRPAWAKRWVVRHHPNVLTVKTHVTISLEKSGGTLACVVMGSGTTATQVTANLLAAAPDLLAACEAAAQYHAGGHEHAFVRMLRDALAKARGK